jgi:hypothetical protein
MARFIQHPFVDEKSPDFVIQQGVSFQKELKNHIGPKP